MAPLPHARWVMKRGACGPRRPSLDRDGRRIPVPLVPPVLSHYHRGVAIEPFALGNEPAQVIQGNGLTHLDLMCRFSGHVLREGLEPPTQGLRIPRSTTELPEHGVVRGDGESRTPTGFSGPTLFSRQLPAPIGWRLHASFHSPGPFRGGGFLYRPTI